MGLHNVVGRHRTELLIWPQTPRISYLRDMLLGLLPGRALPHPPDRPSRILILQPDHFGDLLFVTPALRLLRRELPSARIEIVIGPWNRRAIAGNENIDESFLFEFPWFDRRGRQPLSERLLKLAELVLLIRVRRAEAILIFRPDFWWGALAARLAGAKAIVGQDARQTQGLLTHRMIKQPTSSHIADLNLALAAFVAGAEPTARRELDFQVTEEDRQEAGRLLAGAAPAKNLIVMHVGAGSKVKRWPAEHFAATADELARHHKKLRVVLTAGPTETEIAERVSSLMKEPALNLAGKTSLGSLAAVFEMAAAAIGADSGPLHLAVAVGTPTIHLFGPASAERYGPFGNPSRHIVIGSDLPCSPCGRLDIPVAALAAHDCVRLIAPETVIAAASDLLTRDSPGPTRKDAANT